MSCGGATFGACTWGMTVATNSDSSSSNSVGSTGSSADDAATTSGEMPLSGAIAGGSVGRGASPAAVGSAVCDVVATSSAAKLPNSTTAAVESQRDAAADSVDS